MSANSILGSIPTLSALPAQAVSAPLMALGDLAVDFGDKAALLNANLIAIFSDWMGQITDSLPDLLELGQGLTETGGKK